MWISANVLGAAVGAVLGWALLWFALGTLADTGSPDLLGVLVLIPVVGLGLGVGQWWVLRGYFSRAGWWVLATGLGWLLGLSVDFTFQQLFASSAWQGFALAGLYQAALQWLILRRRGWVTITWLPGSAAAWTAAGFAYTWLSGPLSRVAGADWAAPIVSLTTWVLAAFVFALLTAPLIRRLARKRNRSQPGGAET
jgi:hypothetical protein